MKVLIFMAILLCMLGLFALIYKKLMASTEEKVPRMMKGDGTEFTRDDAEKAHDMSMDEIRQVNFSKPEEQEEWKGALALQSKIRCEPQSDGTYLGYIEGETDDDGNPFEVIGSSSVDAMEKLARLYSEQMMKNIKKNKN